MENISAERMPQGHLAKRERGVTGSHWIELLRFDRHAGIGFHNFFFERHDALNRRHTVEIERAGTGH